MQYFIELNNLLVIRRIRNTLHNFSTFSVLSTESPRFINYIMNFQDVTLFELFHGFTLKQLRGKFILRSKEAVEVKKLIRKNV